MTIALFSVASTLHSEAREDLHNEPFIREIEEALGQSFIYCGTDFSSYGTHDEDILFIRTGGTEGIVKGLELKGDLMLLTSGQSNSLAASMEILAWLRQQGRSGEILHGSASFIAKRLCNHKKSCDGGQNYIKPLPETDLDGIRLGVIGNPSDWLIASDVDYQKAKNKLNAILTFIPMDELISLLKDSTVDMKSFEGSEAVYNALKILIQKYNLGGLTLRCFDLLDSIGNTGCLALARLNAEGIPSSCEGDIPALLSMVMLQKRKGCPGFQCNLSSIDGDRLLFAHCTVPLSMASSYQYTTHFESGIGTAIKAILPLGDVEVFRLSPDLDSFVSIPGKIIANESKPNLCRTQIIVEAPGAAGYFLNSPLANHHIISYK